MNAVTASENVDHSQSVAQQPGDFGVDFSPVDAKVVNGLVHFDGTITPEMIEEAGFDEAMNDYEVETFKETVEDGLLESIEEYDIDGVNIEDLQEWSEDCELSDEELETLLEIQSKFYSLDNIQAVEHELGPEAMEHLATVGVTVVAGVAVAVVAVVAVATGVSVTV